MVREAERILEGINLKIAGQKPSRVLIEAIDPTVDYVPPRQTHADSDYHPFAR